MPFLGTRPAARPKAIIFDIGRVIIDVDMSQAFAFLGQPTGHSPQEVWKALEPTPEWRDWQEGRLSVEAFHKHICKTLGCSLTLDQLRAAWNGMLKPVPLLPDSLFESLASHFRLALLSNTDPIHSAYMEATYSFMRYFAVRVYSCRVGASKPAPAIYRYTLRKLQLAPHEALFLDDIYENAAAAAALGVLALHCAAPEEAAQELARLVKGGS